MDNTVGTMFSQILAVSFSTFALIILIHAFLLGFLTSYVGETKGIKYGFWFGFLLGELGLLTVGLCSPKKETVSDIKHKTNKRVIKTEAKKLYEKGYLTEKTYQDIIDEL